MKKIITILLTCIVLATATGCREKGIQTVRGQVKKVEVHKDTLVSMTVSINERGDTAIFNLDDARLQNGIMMYRDSVIVDYIYGRNDTLRALVVTVLPKIKQFDEPIFSDTLITKPALAE